MYDDNDRLLQKSRTTNKRKRWPIFVIVLGSIFTVGVIWAVWLGSTATKVQGELEAATSLLPSLKQDIADSNREGAEATLVQLREHTALALEKTGHPLWTLSTSIPVIGGNFVAVAEVTRAADDVTNLGLVPLVGVVGSLDWDTLLPTSTGTDLAPLVAASPSVTAAARAVDMSAERLDRIDTTGLVPQVAKPLNDARSQLLDVKDALNSAAVAAQVLPGMLGSDTPRNYLLMIQNNAEARSSGGIPGALAVLQLDKGKLTLGAQSSAGDIGPTTPALHIDQETQNIYSTRVGKFMQDVNLTPDFPTAASTAQAMWERETGQRVDGVVSIDPVVLSYVLEATGPVSVNGAGDALSTPGLPTQLNGENVVQTLLSDVYATIAQPRLQDAYFAAVAQEIFAALSDGKGDAKGLLAGITRGTEEGRVLVWSGAADEQSVLSRFPMSGSVRGPSVSPAEFGVYFNDGTGAKMDYYVRRTVQLVEECPVDGYEQTTVRVTSINTAPLDAAVSLPPYVTGDGIFGVPPGAVQTNIVAYGPVQGNVETVKLNGQQTEFAPYVHATRPVGVYAVRLAPGESNTVEFTFGKIVQHTEPNVFVTPTVQPVKDVILPTEHAPCD